MGMCVVGWAGVGVGCRVRGWVDVWVGWAVDGCGVCWMCVAGMRCNHHRESSSTPGVI